MSEDLPDELSGIYRCAAQAEPGEAAGQALRAAARAAIAPQRAGWPWWLRFRVPVSAAALIVLAGTLTLLVEREEGAREEAGRAAPAVTLPVPAQGTAAPGPAPLAVPSAPTALDTPATPATAAPRPSPLRGGQALATRQEPQAFKALRPEVQTLAPPLGQASAEPSATARQAEAPALPRALENSLPQRHAAAPAASTGATAGAPAASAESAADAAPAVSVKATAEAAPARARAADPAPGGVGEPLSPQLWVERVRVLRAAGRREEAVQALVALHRAWPDYALPEDLRELR